MKLIKSKPFMLILLIALLMLVMCIMLVSKLPPIGEALPLKQTTRRFSLLKTEMLANCTTTYTPLLSSVYQLPRLIKNGAVDLADIPVHPSDVLQPDITAATKYVMSHNEQLVSLRLLFDASITTGTVELPQAMTARIKNSGKDDASFKSQNIVTIHNLYQPEATVSYNYARSQRFGNTLAVGVGPTRDAIMTEMNARKCKPPDFCNPFVYMASNGKWGDLEDDNAIVRANMAKATALHALVVTKHVYQPMSVTRRDYISMFQLTQQWFQEAQQQDPSANRASMIYDMMAKAGASQLHPHFHLYLTPQRYTGKFEAIRRAAHFFSLKHAMRLNYFEELVQVHFFVGLGVAIRSTANNGCIAAFVSLTTPVGAEIVIVAEEDTPAANLGSIFHEIVEGAYKINWTHMSSACAFPSDAGLPLTMCRLVTRGSHTSVTNDVSSNELFATTVSSEDVLQLAGRLRAALGQSMCAEIHLSN